jgi:hypothetical protein
VIGLEIRTQAPSGGHVSPNEPDEGALFRIRKRNSEPF